MARFSISAARKLPIANRGFLHSIREISEYTGLSPATVRRYQEVCGMPIAKRLDGMWFASKTLLDQWMLSLVELQRNARKEEKTRNTD